MKTTRLTWKEFDKAVDWMGRVYPPHPIMAQARGGLALALALSHKWKQNHIYTQFEDLPEKPYVWVDDIYDSGQTYNCLREPLPKLALVWVAKRPLPAGVMCFTVAPPDVWVVFPWEDGQ